LDGPVISDIYTDGVGSIYVAWGGLLGPDVPPVEFAYVAAEISDDAGVTYSGTVGTPITAPGTIVINPNAYGDFLVQLRAYDKLGNPGSVGTAEAISLVDPHVAPPEPLSPTSLSSTPGAGWDLAGINPVSWFDLMWVAPTDDVNSDPVDIVGYDIWGQSDTDPTLRYLTSSQTNSVRWTVTHGEVWTFRARAVSNYGAVSVLSDPVSDTADATISAPSAPTAPTLDEYAGLLRIKWAGGGMVPQVKYVFVSISSDNVTYTRAGMPLNGAGEVVVPGLVAGAYYAKINLVDELDQIVSSSAAGPFTLHNITGLTIETSAVANTGIKMTTSSFTAYDGSGHPTFILNAATGEVWIAPYDAVFDLGASGTVATSGASTTGIAISSQNSNFNTFIHPSGVQIRNDQTALSWWEADASDASLVNFFSPRAYIKDRLRVGDFELLKEAKATGTRLVMRYKGA
jgi:hypothetical protein